MTSSRRYLLLTLGAYGLVTLVMVLLGPRLVRVFYPLPPDQGPAWYYWQTARTGWAIRASYIIGYLLHQIVIWYLVVRARKVRVSGKDGIGRVQYVLLAANVLFVFLHLLQTHLWYDGLARDVPIWTSQGSVIVMLVLILYMIIPVRGLFFGKRFAPPAKMLSFIRKRHGIFISWAVVYTFWFHPMEGNWGLLSGFIYMFLLFTQIQLVGTKTHLNRYWIVLLESLVTIHGTLITIYKHNEIWPMFLFGFLAMFVFTQVYVWKPGRFYSWLLISTYVVMILLVYGFVRGFSHLYEITFIPVALYGGVLLLLGIGWIWDRLSKSGE